MSGSPVTTLPTVYDADGLREFHLGLVSTQKKSLRLVKYEYLDKDMSLHRTWEHSASWAMRPDVPKMQPKHDPKYRVD